MLAAADKLEESKHLLGQILRLEDEEPSDDPTNRLRYEADLVYVTRRLGDFEDAAELAEGPKIYWGIGTNSWRPNRSSHGTYGSISRRLVYSRANSTKQHDWVENCAVTRLKCRTASRFWRSSTRSFKAPGSRQACGRTNRSTTIERDCRSDGTAIGELKKSGRPRLGRLWGTSDA
jgi:hypothetical protein